MRGQEAAALFHELYQPFVDKDRPLLLMSPESAEMTKYAANAILATKISYINEVANLCERAGADVGDVQLGIGHDTRIGFSFLSPGVGYGGSCFPKDTRALIYLSKNLGAPALLMEALGETLSTSYIAVKESDIEGFAAEDEAFEYAAHRFRF